MLNTKFNKSDCYFIAIYFVIFILANIYDHALHFDTTKFIFPDGHITQNFAPPLKGYLIGVPVETLCNLIVIALFFLWLIPTFLVKQRNYLLFFALTIIIAIFFGVIATSTWHWAENKPWQTYPTLFYSLLGGLGLTVENSGLPLGILLAKKYYESQIQIERINKQSKESKLRQLQAQMNPHFMFNNLNTLDLLVHTSPEKAKKYIAHLSSLYRYLIETKDDEIVLVSKEIEMIQHYFQMIKTRFGQVYSFTFSEIIAPTNKYIPIGALQLIIENVIKHNKSTLESPINATITIERNHISVVNNKSLSEPTRVSFGTGIQNLKDRYELLFQKPIEINNTNTHYEITIPIIELKSYSSDDYESTHS